MFKHTRCILNLYMIYYYDESFEEEKRLLEKFIHRCIENRDNMFGLGLKIHKQVFINMLLMSDAMKKRSDIATPDKNRNFPLHLLCKGGKQFQYT